MRKKFLLILILFATAKLAALAQSYTADDTVSAMRAYEQQYKLKQAKPKEYFRKFTKAETYVALGAMTGEIRHSEAELDMGMNINFGVKVRRQLHQNWAFITMLDWVYEDYQIKNGALNNIFNIPAELPGRCTPDCENFHYWGAGIGFGARFNFDKQPIQASYNKTAMGTYLELIAYGHLKWAQYYDVTFTGIGNIEKQLRYSDTSLFPMADAGLQLSFGWNLIGFWGRYRLTDCFKSRYSSAKLPPFSIGASFNLSYP